MECCVASWAVCVFGQLALKLVETSLCREFLPCVFALMVYGKEFNVVEDIKVLMLLNPTYEFLP